MTVRPPGTYLGHIFDGPDLPDLSTPDAIIIEAQRRLDNIASSYEGEICSEQTLCNLRYQVEHTLNWLNDLLPLPKHEYEIKRDGDNLHITIFPKEESEQIPFAVGDRVHIIPEHLPYCPVWAEYQETGCPLVIIAFQNNEPIVAVHISGNEALVGRFRPKDICLVC